MPVGLVGADDVLDVDAGGRRVGEQPLARVVAADGGHQAHRRTEPGEVLGDVAADAARRERETVPGLLVAGTARSRLRARTSTLAPPMTTAPERTDGESGMGTGYGGPPMSRLTREMGTWPGSFPGPVRNTG